MVLCQIWLNWSYHIIAKQAKTLILYKKINFASSWVLTWVLISETAQEMFYKNMFLKISQNWQGNTCVGVSFNKAAYWKTASLLKKWPQLWSFPVNLVKFLRTSFLKNTSSGWNEIFLIRWLVNLIAFYMKEDRMKLITGLIYLWLFWQK